jgi:hypothetical protein
LRNFYLNIKQYKPNPVFEDGAIEELQYILYFSDVQNDGNLGIDTTKHDVPRAGIMLGHQNGYTVMYLLVSE